MATPPRLDRLKGAPQRQSSPEVRSAVAALRAKYKQQRPTERGSNADRDPFRTKTPEERRDDEEESLGMISTSSLVEQAMTTGKLRIADRSLKEIPSQVWRLLPPDSIHHPSNKLSARKSSKGVNLDLSRDNSNNTKWYECKPLSILNASGNEICEFPEELSGFDKLQQLDLRSNLISALPIAISQLECLGVLNLSANRLLGSIPLALLGLPSLTSLDLSHNKLETLWTLDWKEQLHRLQEEISIDAANTSSGSDFWAAFPSMEQTTTLRGEGNISGNPDGPWPLLRNLNLAHNKFTSDSFSAIIDHSRSTFPTTLTHLDISHNSLDRFPTQLIPQFALLHTLNLSYNNLSNSAVLFGNHTDPFLPALRNLDVASNGMDSLAFLDVEFAYAKMSLIGLPKNLQQFHPTGRHGDDILHINVAGNYLRDEVSRVRRNLASKRSQTPLDFSNDFKKTLSDEEPQNCAANLATSNHSDQSTPKEKDYGFPYFTSVDRSSKTLLLANRTLKLQNLKISVNNESAEGIDKADLSKNQLTAMPVAWLQSWSLADGLVSLNLSRNSISSLQFESVTLPNLQILNLSGNRLCQTDLLNQVAKSAPQLETLDVSLNNLNSIEGVDQLLANGLLSLRTANNQITSLDPVAQYTNEPNANLTKCREMDFSDNAISKLPIELGRFELDALLVAGNTFKIPNRKVWENGGSKGLLKWLRERA